MIKVLLGFKFLIFCILVAWLLPIRFAVTDSVAHRIFYMRDLSNLQKGDYVLFKRKKDNISSPSFIRATIKQIAGVPGDLIEERKGELFINGHSMGFAKPTTNKGKKLDPLKSGVIPEGYYFLYGTGKNSFDSRYAAMGLVFKKEFIAHAIPLW